MKEMTYAEHQYRLAGQMIREADRNSEDQKEYAAAIWSEMAETIEDGYFRKAYHSISQKSRRGHYGVDFWKRAYGRIVWGQGSIPKAIKIKAHVINYFQPL